MTTVYPKVMVGKRICENNITKERDWKTHPGEQHTQNKKSMLGKTHLPRQHTCRHRSSNALFTVLIYIRLVLRTWVASGPRAVCKKQCNLGAKYGAIFLPKPRSPRSVPRQCVGNARLQLLSPTKPRNTKCTSAPLVFLGFRAALADPILEPFHGPKRRVGGPVFGSIIWTQKQGHMFMIHLSYIKEPNTMVPEMGSQNGPKNGPRKTT